MSVIPEGEEFILTFLAGGSWFLKVNEKHKTYKRFFYYERHRKMIYYEGSKKRTKGKHLPRCKYLLTFMEMFVYVSTNLCHNSLYTFRRAS